MKKKKKRDPVKYEMVIRKGQEERNSGCVMGTCGVKGFGGQDSFCIRCLEHTNPQRQKKKKNQWWSWKREEWI